MAAAFGPILEKKFNLASATTISIAAATVGLFVGSLIGGPVGKMLMRKNSLKPEGLDEADSGGVKIPRRKKILKITESGIFQAVVLVSIAIGFGSIISYYINKMEIIMPGYIGTMIAVSVKFRPSSCLAF